jgi:SAM-dependent methyltransferase
MSDETPELHSASMLSSWLHGGHPTAHSLGMPRWRFARVYRSNEDVRRVWWTGYDEAKDRALADTLDSPELLERFRSGRSLPRGFGFTLDERIVEIPWVVANLPSEGPVLDAGSALNHPLILERVMPRVESLTITTFTEEEHHPDLGPDYVTADLRELPFENGSFETIVCISTLDHIGMDNSAYGAKETRSDDPDHEVSLAMSELHRVLRPGGRLLVTVPYGRPEDHGWCRQFDQAGVRRIAESFDDPGLSIYRHSRRGWNASSLEGASGATYRDPRRHEVLLKDCAFAASAVACLRLTRQGSPGVEAPVPSARTGAE